MMPRTATSLCTGSEMSSLFRHASLSWVNNLLCTALAALSLDCICGYRVQLPCLGMWGEAVASLPWVQNVSTVKVQSSLGTVCS